MILFVAIALTSCVDPPTPDPQPDIQYSILNPPILLCADQQNLTFAAKPEDSDEKVFGLLKTSDSLDVNHDGIYDLKFSFTYDSFSKVPSGHVEALHENCYYSNANIGDSIRINDTNWSQELSNIYPYADQRAYLTFKLIDNDGIHVGWIRHSSLSGTFPSMRGPTSYPIWYIEAVAHGNKAEKEFLVGEKQ